MSASKIRFGAAAVKFYSIRFEAIAKSWQLSKVVATIGGPVSAVAAP
jgi:hypothetical protein